MILHYRGTSNGLEAAIKRINKGSVSEQEKKILIMCHDHANIVKYYNVVSYTSIHFISIN